MRGFYLLILFLILSVHPTLGQKLELFTVNDNTTLVDDSQSTDPQIILSSFPNYTFQDHLGNNVNIYNYLNSGKTVLLNFVSNWNKESMERIHVLNHLYSIYEETNDKIKVITLEINTHNSLTTAGVNSTDIPEKWGINHSFVNLNGLDAFLTSLISSTPTQILISPNKTYKIHSSISTNAKALTALNKSFLQSQGLSYDYDLDILGFRYYKCANDYVFVGYIQNTALNTINSHEIYIEDKFTNIIDSQEVNLVLQPNDLIEFIYTIPQNQVAEAPVKLHLKTTHTTENKLNNLRSAISIDYSFKTKVNLTIQPDNYPEETGWFLYNKTTQQIEYSDGIDINNETVTGMSSGLYQQSFYLQNNNCYRFVIIDTYNDGICCGNGIGYFTLTEDSTGNTIAKGGNFLNVVIRDFEVSDNNINVTETDYLEENKTPIKIVITNILGQILKEEPVQQVYFKKIYFNNGEEKVLKLYKESNSN